MVSLTHDLSRASLLISTVAGAATSGISAFANVTKGAVGVSRTVKASVTVGKFVCTVVVDAAVGAGNQMVKNSTNGKPITEGTIGAAVTRIVGGKIGEGTSKVVGNVISTTSLNKIAKLRQVEIGVVTQIVQMQEPLMLPQTYRVHKIYQSHFSR